jgi:hypothetical protein
MAMSDVPKESEEEFSSLPSRTGELYIPKSLLDANVKRMAWLLFMEWWKDAVRDSGMTFSMKAEKVFTAYEVSVTAAKLVWHEQEKGYEHGEN